MMQTVARVLCALVVLGVSVAAAARPTIEELKSRKVLDDYEANVVYGYNIVTDTSRYAARYVGNRLQCSNCHLQAGTKPHAIPLDVEGLYPKWRSKNGVRNGLGLRIRECFLYSMNGIMPPEEAPEVQAVSAYIHYLSEGQVIGRLPPGARVPMVPETGEDPNPARGETVYHRICAACHGPDGHGTAAAPPLWGPESYNAGAGMNDVRKAAGFIWANMPVGNENSLSPQEALDVAAFLHLQIRPADPRDGRLRKLMERLVHRVSELFGATQ
ncbi:MAG: c-type cytochrome [Betaproteobacteria bacterium]|nr:c-type cytochrome [Betaproteobacteria bacterium]